MAEHLGPITRTPEPVHPVLDGPEEPEQAEKIAYWSGRYDELKRLATSPRMKPMQMEVINDEAFIAYQKLRELGVTFSGDLPEGWE